MQASVLLCDHAQVWQGKLFVSGAGIGLVGAQSAEPPHPVNIAAAILIEVPWQAHNQLHKLRVALVDSEEALVSIAQPSPGVEVSADDMGAVLADFNAGRAALMQPGDSSLLPLAIPLNVALPQLGGYEIRVSVDGTELAKASFRVLHAKSVGMG